MLQGSILYKKNHEVIYLRCLGKKEVDQVLKEFYDKFGMGHGSGSSTVHQILRVGIIGQLSSRTFIVMSTHVIHVRQLPPGKGMPLSHCILCWR